MAGIRWCKREVIASSSIRSTKAASIEEAETLIREGIEFHIEGLREDGLPIPAPQAQVKQIAIPA